MFGAQGTGLSAPLSPLRLQELLKPLSPPLFRGAVLKDWPDEQLIVLAAHPGPQREAAFEVLVRRYAGQIHRLAANLVGSAHADDIVQEVLMSAYHHLNGFRGDAPLGAWLHRVTVNACNKALSARRSLALEDVAEPVSPGGPVNASEQRALRDTLACALATLPPEQREVVALRELSDLDYADIAQLTGTSLGTVKSRLSRGRAALREWLTHAGFAPERTPHD